MLEKKIVLFSHHRALISHCALAFINMLYPFSWPHVFIPILPESLKAFLEAPVPFLIGLDTETTESYQDLPLEVMRVNLDNNKVLIGESIPKIPSAYYKLLQTRLKQAIPFEMQKPDPILDAVDQAFNVILMDPDERVEFNHLLVRDAILEFMAKLLRGYEKLIVKPFIYISRFHISQQVPLENSKKYLM
jgi:hypothetical protein